MWSPFWKTITSLARQVEGRWAETECRLQDFPSIATDALQGIVAQESLSYESIIDGLCSQSSWSDQLALTTKFGEPAITVYKNSRWAIDLYFWVSPCTSIHNHKFRGAFSVLHGVSLEERFSFAVRISGDAKNDDLEVGKLEVEETNLVKAGQVLKIEPGIDLIHRVTHLSSPTVSIVIRTSHEHSLPAQREYFMPSVSVESAQGLSTIEKRKLELIEMLVRTKEVGRVKHVERLLESESRLFSFWALHKYFISLGRVDGEVSHLADKVFSGKQELVGEVTKVFEQLKYQQQRLASQLGESQRLIVALSAINIPHSDLRRLIRAYDSSKEPGELYYEWCRAMLVGDSCKSIFGQMLKPRSQFLKIEDSNRSLMLLQRLCSKLNSEMGPETVSNQLENRDVKIDSSYLHHWNEMALNSPVLKILARADSD